MIREKDAIIAEQKKTEKVLRGEKSEREREVERGIRGGRKADLAGFAWDLWRGLYFTDGYSTQKLW
jgi:hypothetical protein